MYLLFQVLKKKQKGTGTLAAVSRAKAPGRNYKLLPALAIDSPLGCQCGYAAASRPQRFLTWEKTNIRFLTVGTGVPDCPKRTVVGASPRPTIRSHWCGKTKLSDLKYNACFRIKPRSDSRGRLSLHYNAGDTVRPYESENTFCLCTNKPNLKAPLSKGSWRRQATEGL